MLFITLPGLTAIIVLNATLSLGSVLNAGFDQIVNMYSTVVYRTGDVIDTLVYRVGIQGVRNTLPRYEIATTIGLFKSVVSSILISVAYYCAYKFADYRIF
jgi:putative aldouronate transport system permease protein